MLSFAEFILSVVLCVIDSFGLCFVSYSPVDYVMCCRFIWIVFCVVGYPVDCVMCCRFPWIVFRICRRKYVVVGYVLVDCLCCAVDYFMCCKLSCGLCNVL